MVRKSPCTQRCRAASHSATPPHASPSTHSSAAAAAAIAPGAARAGPAQGRRRRRTHPWAAADRRRFGGGGPRGAKPFDSLPHRARTAADNPDSGGREHLFGIGPAVARENVGDAPVCNPLGCLDSGATAQIFTGVFDRLEFKRIGFDDQETGAPSETGVYQFIQGRTGGADCNFHGFHLTGILGSVHRRRPCSRAVGLRVFAVLIFGCVPGRLAFRIRPSSKLPSRNAWMTISS